MSLIHETTVNFRLLISLISARNAGHKEEAMTDYVTDAGPPARSRPHFA